MNDSDQDINDPKNYIKDHDFHIDEDDNMKGGRGVREIFENEISEPEIMLFCKGDQQSTELLQLYSNLAKEQQYDSLILKIKNQDIDENSDKDHKCHFVKNFYLVNIF